MDFNSIPDVSDVSLDGFSFGQKVIYGVAGLFLLWQMLKGWSIGLGRKLCSISAIVIGGGAGYYGAPLLIPYISDYLAWPTVLLRTIATSMLGFSVYLMIKIIGAIFIKKTGDYKDFVTRIINGVGGSIVGLSMGVFWLMLITYFIRFLYNVTSGDEAKESSNDAVGVLYSISSAVNDSYAGRVIAELDPVPNSVYELSGKSAKVLKDPNAIAAFGQSEEFKKLSQNPMVQSYATDPEILKIIKEKKYPSLLTHPKTSELLKDPAFLDLLKSLDVESALDNALAPAANDQPFVFE